MTSSVPHGCPTKATVLARGARISYDERARFLFVAPLAAVLFAVAVFPILYSFYISLFSLRLTRPDRVPFVWLDNYVAVLTDPQFWEAVQRTVIFSVMAVAAIAVIALLVALLLNRGIPRAARAERHAARALGDSLCRQRADVEVDL